MSYIVMLANEICLWQFDMASANSVDEFAGLDRQMSHSVKTGYAMVLSSNH